MVVWMYVIHFYKLFFIFCVFKELFVEISFVGYFLFLNLSDYLSYLC